ncbi:hypothetical protein DUNSADRAFT_13524 [Dunaliella salina]|uniref:MHD2 domain-containing protein n=1 Tax=Dunaliella salina TaxID=3046 RepID=A0ABQ7G959_DUNSA|nr:hypothetical protein DUNSADRAFT_13524 [Dunaliella salina]|eukprot:KAF5831144.1 hypothetical protein DUNSADRAFT_13524 [Dunaliella salina]
MWVHVCAHESKPFAPPPQNPFLSGPPPPPNPFLSPAPPPPPPNPFLPEKAVSGGGSVNFGQNQSNRPPPQHPISIHANAARAPRPPGFGEGLTNGTSPADAKSAVTELPPKLGLPILETGLEDKTLDDLAYHVFMACLGPSAHGKPQQGVSTHQLQQRQALAVCVREQLRISEPRTKVTHVLLSLLASGGSDWKPTRLCSLEGLSYLMNLARPGHFADTSSTKSDSEGAFDEFVRWRRSTGAVLHSAARLAVAPWQIGEKQDGGGPYGDQQAQAARKVLSRLCGALRRMDVGLEDEMDEDEYAEAAAATMREIEALACLPSIAPTEGAPTCVGWALPWALRVRVAEKLLFSVFSSPESSTFVEDAMPLTLFLETVVWPALGIEESLAVALNVWVHLRQYIVTGDISLSRLIKNMLAKLAATAPPQPTPGVWVSPNDQVTSEVRKVGVTNMVKRLSDYHAKFPHGKEGEMQAMLDVLAFAQRLDPKEADLGLAITELARGSACKQFGRAVGPILAATTSVEQVVLDTISIAQHVLEAEERTYAPLLGPHYPQQAGIQAGICQHLAETSAAIHAKLGKQLLLPWINSGPKLDPLVAKAFSAALKLDDKVAKTVATALDSPSTVQSAAMSKGAGGLASFCKWPLAEPLKIVTVEWASLQVERLNTWVTRQLQQEKWVAVNGQDGCAQSAVEALKLVEESLESLYSLGLPLHFEGGLGALDIMMSGIDSAMENFAQATMDKIGSTARVVPPTPPVTRFKKEVATKQESAEASLLANVGGVPPPPKKGQRVRIPGSKRWTSNNPSNSISLLDLVATFNFKSGKNPAGIFLESVPRVGTSPDYALINKALTTPVIICCLMSAQFLLGRLDTLAEAAYKHLQEPFAIVPASRHTGGDQPKYLTSSSRALTNALVHACNFLCCKAVYWDMRSAWCEHLYRHRVSGGAPFSTNIEPLLDGLNQVLADIGNQMPDNTRAFFAAELLKVVCEAYNRTLLDGGPCRWFSPEDVPALEADLQQLALLFEAEGEGLPR